MRIRLIRQTTLAVLLLLGSAAIGNAEDSTQAPTPPIYDTTAVLSDQIAEALTQARDSDRRVMIQWGANWCVWCRLLHGLFTSDSLVNQTLESNYVWVLADVGRKDKNLDLQEFYGVDQKAGIPFLTVLDTTGAVVIHQETGALETGDKEKRGHDPQKVIAFLKKNSGRKAD